MAIVQKITGLDLVKLTASQEFIIRKQSLEHKIYKLQEHIMAKQGMA